MSDNLHVEYDQAPPLAPIYRRLLLQRGQRLKQGERLPTLTVRWPYARVRTERLHAYQALSGFACGASVPITYPHLMAGWQQMALMAMPQFPLSPLGSVHMREHIVQRRPVQVDETLDSVVTVGKPRVVKKGLEFDLVTRMSVQHTPVWQSISTYMVRGRFGEEEPRPAKARLPELQAPNQEHSWRVPRNMGRRYAWVSKDFNPIHLSGLMARLFGFSRALVHGFWTAGRCLPELTGPPADAPQRYDVLFKGPVYLGSTVRLKAGTGKDATRFDLYCGENPRPVVQGNWRRADADEAP